MTAGYTVTQLAGLTTVTALNPRDADRGIFVGSLGNLDGAARAILRAAGHEPNAEDVAVFVRQFMGCFADNRSGARTLRADIVATWIEWRRERRDCA